MDHKHYLVGFNDLEHAEKIAEAISDHAADTIVSESLLMSSFYYRNGYRFCRKSDHPLKMRLDTARIMEDADVLVVYGMSKDKDPIKELIKLTEIMGIRTVYVGDDIRSRYQTPVFGPFKIRWDNVICFHRELMEDVPLDMLSSHYHDAAQNVIRSFNGGMLPTPCHYSVRSVGTRYCVRSHAMYDGDGERENSVDRAIKRIITVFEDNPRRPTLPNIEFHLTPYIPGQE